jgi:hypothetical protein
MEIVITVISDKEGDMVVQPNKWFNIAPSKFAQQYVV